MNIDYYKSDKELTITVKDFYTDRKGFANEKAFYHFVKGRRDMFRETPFYLVCVNIDLRKANATNYEYGDYVLRKFILELSDYSVFRIQGEKFNILVEGDRLEALKHILDKQYDDCDIYYGVIEERFIVDTEKDVKNYIRKGISLMFEHKDNTKQKKNGIIGNKGNTPPELRETNTRKHRCTMWYTIKKIRIIEPRYKELTFFIFPTEYKPPLATIKLAVAMWDGVNYRAFYSNIIEFVVDGIPFNINARYDDDGHLNIMFYHDKTIGSENKCTVDYNDTNEVTAEGNCVPATFGKRITPTRQIFPLRKNARGYYDYIDLNTETETISVNTEGVIEGANGRKYGVTQDTNYIDLIPLEEQENRHKIISVERTLL